ncbi:MAG TPA: hypothetical protein PK530_07805, partial [Anaerolineales bacterium]|nr:hypothetical protein [Anaerolineales bacterium]
MKKNLTARLNLLLVSLLLVVYALSFWARPASAANFTVINTNDSGAGSLRQAILNANSNPGPDTIDFNIPGGGVHTISPVTNLP